MMIRAEITDDERRVLKSRAARDGVSFQDYVTEAIRLGAQAMLATSRANGVPMISDAGKGEKR